ncbi:MAG TPA: TolC family protein [Vicinamibacterales bacterium]|nr:TolC family protein [Vicinamibacterales bacterium]
MIDRIVSNRAHPASEAHRAEALEMRRGWLLAIAILAIVSPMAQAQVTNAGTQPSQQVTLEQALQYAVDHYPSVKAALEQVNASSAQITIARGAYLPRFDSLWQTNRATANNVFGQLLPQSVLPSISGPVLATSTSESVWGSATGGLLSWEPFDLGLRSAVVREAEAELARDRAQQGLTRLSVQNAVGMAFLGIVAAQQAVTAADADVERRDVLARAARTLADNQLRPGAEASRAEAELAVARTRAIQARQVLTIAQTTFGQMLGMADGTMGIDAGRLLESAPQGSQAHAGVQQHPLVQSGQASIDLAQSRETVLARTDRPRVYVQSSVFARGTGANPDGQFDGSADGLGLDRANWAAGVQVIFPNLFDFSTLHARRAAAGALTRAERARYDEAVLTVSSQQRTADAVLDAARAIAQNTPIQLAAAQQSEAQARARYQAGLASIVEVAEAQNLLAGAEYQNAVARVDVWRALLSLAVANGTVASFIDQLRTSGVQ